jgi:hypothetical protein
MCLRFFLSFVSYSLKSILSQKESKKMSKDHENCEKCRVMNLLGHKNCGSLAGELGLDFIKRVFDTTNETIDRAKALNESGKMSDADLDLLFDAIDESTIVAATQVPGMMFFATKGIVSADAFVKSVHQNMARAMNMLDPGLILKTIAAGIKGIKEASPVPTQTNSPGSNTLN